ncbi:DUF1643 domain-containing protein [Kribbella sp. NPDC056861]|uniref:DUF1643 domain-containing protein n=1 Tax=Kribbella sp. NPDC056861 TaxID=3154857 RepID=UPI00343973A2
MSPFGVPPLTVGAILLNPSADPQGSVSVAMLRALRDHRGWAAVPVVNLVNTPSRDSRELSQLAGDSRVWEAARGPLEQAIRDCDELLLGWGVSPLAGAARPHQRAQVRWVLNHARAHGHTRAWMLAGAPRHPSRWRQFVGPQRGLIVGGSTIDRIDQLLTYTRLNHAEPGIGTSLVRPIMLAGSNPGE